MTRLLRYRYALLTAWGAAWAVPIWQRYAHQVSDYDYLAAGGRALLGNMPNYHASALHTYTQMPWLQVGPPTLFLSGLCSQLRWVGQGIWGALILTCGLLAIYGLDRTLTNLGRPRPGAVLAAGAVLLPCWATYQMTFHLEDAWTVAAISLSVAAISRHRPWWIPALLIGSAIACKPWAVIGLPLLLTYPKRDALRGATLTAAIAVVPWLPFVIADPNTLHAVAAFKSPVSPTSALYALGVHGYTSNIMRSLSMVVGLLLGSLMVLRGRWLAAPLAAFGGRLLFEPRYYLYYGVGPVLAALLWDLTRERRFPVWTVAVLSVHFGLRELAVNGVNPGGLIRVESLAELGLALAVIVALTLGSPVRRTTEAQREPQPVTV